MIPLLSRFVPSDLAAKGLGKIDPKMKDFLNKAIGYGYSAETALNFLRQQFAPHPRGNDSQSQ